MADFFQNGVITTLQDITHRPVDELEADLKVYCEPQPLVLLLPALYSEFEGPAIINCYTTCQPEHGVGDNMAADQARLAVDTRAFPLLIYDPRKGDTIRSRLSLQGNPAMKEDWWTNPKTGETLKFIDFCRSEGRFAKHFDKDGDPSELLLWAEQERLANWHQLQELAGIRS